MSTSVRRIAGSAVALVAVAGLALPAVANAADTDAPSGDEAGAGSLSSLGDSSLSELATTASLEGVINSVTGEAPQLSVEADPDDTAALDVTLATYAPVGDGADDVSCAAQIGGPFSGLDDVPTAADLSETADPLVVVDNGTDDSGEATVALNPADYTGGLYIITSACWQTDAPATDGSEGSDGAGSETTVVDGTLASGNAVVLSVNGGNADVLAMLPTGVAALLDSVVSGN